MNTLVPVLLTTALLTAVPAVAGASGPEQRLLAGEESRIRLRRS